METFATIMLFWIFGGWFVYAIAPSPKSDIAAVLLAIACGPLIWASMSISFQRTPKRPWNEHEFDADPNELSECQRCGWGRDHPNHRSPR